jgi:type III pantothenate kinase
MSHSVVAVDIGNSFIKAAVLTDALIPLDLHDASVATFKLEDIGKAQWLDFLGPCAVETQWFLASVNQSTLAGVVQWLDSQTIPKKRTILTHQQIPLDCSAVAVEQVGVDRLLSALGAMDVLVNPCPVVVVDIGTAVTIDAVTAEGEFLGGVIMPSIYLSSIALANYTDRLPEVDVNISDLPGLPQAIGTCTQDAVRGGLVWGFIGAIEAVVTRQQKILGPGTHLIVDGADSEVVSNLPFDASSVDHLCLRGIIHVAQNILDQE